MPTLKKVAITEGSANRPSFLSSKDCHRVLLEPPMQKENGTYDEKWGMFTIPLREVIDCESIFQSPFIQYLSRRTFPKTPKTKSKGKKQLKRNQPKMDDKVYVTVALPMKSYQDIYNMLEDDDQQESFKSINLKKRNALQDTLKSFFSSIFVTEGNNETGPSILKSLKCSSVVMLHVSRNKEDYVNWNKINVIGAALFY